MENDDAEWFQAVIDYIDRYKSHTPGSFCVMGDSVSWLTAQGSTVTVLACDIKPNVEDTYCNVNIFNGSKARVQLCYL